MDAFIRNPGDACQAKVCTAATTFLRQGLSTTIAGSEASSYDELAAAAFDAIVEAMLMAAAAAGA